MVNSPQPSTRGVSDPSTSPNTSTFSLWGIPSIVQSNVPQLSESLQQPNSPFDFGTGANLIVNTSGIFQSSASISMSILVIPNNDFLLGEIHI